MSYRAEEGAAASGLAINLPDSISPEVLMAALQIGSDLRQSLPSHVDRDAVTVGKGAAGNVAVNVYSTKKQLPDQNPISNDPSVCSPSDITSDEQLLELVRRKRQPVDMKVLQTLSRRPKEEENFELAFLILDDWEELKLYITPNSEQFKRRTKTIAADQMADMHKKSKRFLDMWVATFGSQANVYRLCKALIERGKRGHAEEIFGPSPVAFIADHGTQ